MQKTLSDKADIRILFLTCYITYFLCYVGRLNYGVLIVEIVKNNVISKSEAGLVSTGAFFSYGIGQLISGFLSKKFSPKYMMLCGISFSMVCNLIMAFLSNGFLMMLVWIVNGFAQSFMWVPILKLFSEYLTYKDGVRINTHFPSSSIAAAFFVSLFSSLIISLLNWRFVFIFTVGFLIIAMIVWMAGITRSENKINQIRKTDLEEKALLGEEDSPPEVQKYSFKALYITSGFMVIAFITLIQGILKDGVSTWIPTLISEKFKIETFLAILITSVLPIISIAINYSASILNKKIFRNEAKTGAFFFFIAALSATGLLLLNSSSLLFSSMLLALISSCITAINLILNGFVPLHFSKWKISATIGGIQNSITYLGSALSVYGFGAISEKRGWDFVVILWILLSVLGCASFLFIFKRWKIFTNTVSRLD